MMSSKNPNHLELSEIFVPARILIFSLRYLKGVFDSIILDASTPIRNSKRIQKSLSLAYFMTNKTMTIQSKGQIGAFIQKMERRVHVSTFNASL